MLAAFQLQVPGFVERRDSRREANLCGQYLGEQYLALARAIVPLTIKQCRSQVKIAVSSRVGAMSKSDLATSDSHVLVHDRRFAVNMSVAAGRIAGSVNRQRGAVGPLPGASKHEHQYRFDHQ